MVVLVAAQLCKYTRNHWVVHLEQIIYVNNISTKGEKNNKTENKWPTDVLPYYLNLKRIQS